MSSNARLSPSTHTLLYAGITITGFSALAWLTRRLERRNAAIAKRVEEAVTALDDAAVAVCRATAQIRGQCELADIRRTTRMPMRPAPFQRVQHSDS